MSQTKNPHDTQAFTEQLHGWARELGFAQLGISDIDLSSAEASLQQWLARGYHGEKEYMYQHGTKRSRPAELVEGTLSIISVRMDYLPEGMDAAWRVLSSPSLEKLDPPGRLSADQFHQRLGNKDLEIALLFPQNGHGTA